MEARETPRALERLRARVLPYLLLVVATGVVLGAWLLDPGQPVLVAGATIAGAMLVAVAASLRQTAKADTELRSLAESLARGEEWFRVIVRDSADITIVTDELATLRYVSPAATKMLGYEPDEMVGTNVFDLLHPDDAAAALEGFADLALEGMVYPLQVRVRRADGTFADVEAIGANQLENPAVAGLVITVRDVSDRNVALAQLAEAERRFADAFEQAPIGMAITDGEGVIVRANRSVAKLLDRPADSLPGLRVSELTHPDDREMSERELRRLWNGEIERYQLEKRYLRPDGTPVWVALSVSLLRDAKGDPLHTIGQIEDVTERRAMVERLAHQAVHDSLTGLPNRVLFVDRLRHALGRARQAGHQVAIVFLDLDRFKLVNDSLGHTAGDQLLSAIAGRLQSTVSETDTVARFGGDEFAVLCEDVTGEQAALATAQRIATVFDSPVRLRDGEVFVTASIGVAVSDDNDTAQTLLRDADTAMYRAKDNGRARIEVFVAGAHDRVMESLRTTNALHRALQREELELHYQPVVEVRTGQVHGFEALLRWRHPERGLVMPTEFIPHAEESGLIAPIGMWVLEEACRQTVAWQRDSGEPLTVSVNLSPRQLADSALPTQVKAVLERTGIRPEHVWLEITETALMHDAESAGAALRALRALGVHLAVDDFGTGYSSLTYLKRFPVEALKVDRSFVDGLGRDPEDTAIVTAVVSLAHALGLVAVAEGLETETQLAELLTLGCDHAQGYLIGRPQPARVLDGSVADVATWQRLATPAG